MENYYFGFRVGDVSPVMRENPRDKQVGNELEIGLMQKLSTEAKLLLLRTNL